VTITTPGQPDLLTFSGTAGQYASVQVSNYNFSGWCCASLSVSILNPDSTTLVAANLNPGNLFLSPVALPATGTYTLVISPQSGNTGSGTFTLSVFSEQSAAITPGTPTGVTITTPGQPDLLTFGEMQRRSPSILRDRWHSRPSTAWLGSRRRCR
jgi:hypothetical protein